MYKVKDAVKTILFHSEVAMTAFSEGYLNFSGYAKKILKDVEKEIQNKTTVGNIVVSLSRLKAGLKGKKYGPVKNMLPNVFLKDIVVKSSLVEVTFENTIKTRELLNKIQTSEMLLAENTHMISRGIEELTIILSSKLKDKLLNFFKLTTPKVILDNLTSVTVRFDPEFLYVPNTIYVIMRELALKQINIIEIISTFTELSVVINKKELSQTFEVLNTLIDNN